MFPPLLEGEFDWLASVVDELTNDDLKLVYADWLEERGDPRGVFLRRFATASRSMRHHDFPEPRWMPEEWLELIGFRLVKAISLVRRPRIKEPLLRLARPALRLVESDADDEELAFGASKCGGLPDLPAGFRWPTGAECRATLSDRTDGIQCLAGFLAQVNFENVAGSQATRGLPQKGVLSFFGYQSIEAGSAQVIGAKAFFFPDPMKLCRTAPPEELTGGNRELSPSQLHFEETLDLPERSSGPWSDEVNLSRKPEFRELFEVLADRNVRNLFGYGRKLTGGDPTPSKDSRHLIALNNSVGCRLHIQIPQKDLTSLNFDTITLAWVDFDP